MTEAWATVEAELDRAFDTGRTIQIWLRDDDCVAVTPALERLAALCRRLDLPILLAVIPEPAEPDLAGWIAAIRRDAVSARLRASQPCSTGERARELGGLRPAEAVLDDLTRGRAKLQALFGGRLSDILVPPWNRIDADLVPRLPALGYAALSTFGPPEPGGMRRLNSDLDIIDWRNGRVGRPLDDLARKLAGSYSIQDRRAVRMGAPPVVMAGLVPGTHAERRHECKRSRPSETSRCTRRRGWPGQARP